MKFLIILMFVLHMEANEIEITKTSNTANYKSRFNTVGSLRVTTGIFLFSLQLDTSKYIKTLDLLQAKGAKMNATMEKIVKTLKKRKGAIADLKTRQFIYREFSSLQLTLGLLERSAAEHKIMLLDHLLTIESSEPDANTAFSPDNLVYRKKPNVKDKQDILEEEFDNQYEIDERNEEFYETKNVFTSNQNEGNKRMENRLHKVNPKLNYKDYLNKITGKMGTKRRTRRGIVKPSISHLGRGVNSFTSYVYNALGIGSVGNIEDILKELDVMTANQQTLKDGVNKNIIALNATIEHVLGLEEDIKTINSIFLHVQVSISNLIQSSKILVSEVNIAIQLLNLKVNFDSLNNKIEMFI